MQQSTSDTTLQLVRPFFGNSTDVRGEYFTHLNYVGSEFGVAINSGNIDSIRYQPVFQLLLTQNYKQENDSDKRDDWCIHENIIDLIKNTAAFHRLIDKEAKKDPKANKLLVDYVYNSIYTGWNNLPSDVRTFYKTFLHVLIETPGGWMQPADVAIAISSNPTNVRLNLTKVDKNNPNSGILFAETLPKIPDIIRGFYITEGQYVKKYEFAHNNHRENILKTIYNELYNSSYDNYVNFDQYPQRFLLDCEKFTKTVILAHADGIAAKKTATDPSSKDNFDDIYTSLTTGVTFVRENNKLFRVDGDKKTPINEDTLEQDIKDMCAKSKFGDCDIVFKCLLSGEPKNLSRCLSKLGNEDMFKVAHREIEQMNPEIALQLLRTFGFNPRKEIPTGLVLPPSFDEWATKILPRSVDEETQKTIRNNKQLMNYLNGIVSLIRNNPTIIAANRQGSVDPSDYAKKAQLQVFIQPKTMSERSALTASILEQGVLLSRSGVNMFPLGGLFGNVGMNMGSQPFLLQGGGAKSECVNANMLKNMFDVTYSEMERNGKVLVDADKNRINDSIKRVAHLEEQLIKILEDLKLFTKLNTTFSIGSAPVGVEEVALTDVVGASNVANITSEAVSNLRNSASQNIAEQSRLMSDLILQIQRSLVGTLMGNERNPLLQKV